MSYKLRFTRDETSNDVTFLIKGKKSRRLTVSLTNLALALMAGKEVPCKMTISKEVEKKVKRAKKRIRS